MKEHFHRYEDATDWTCAQFFVKVPKNHGYNSDEAFAMAAAYLDANPSAFDSNPRYRTASILDQLTFVWGELEIWCSTRDPNLPGWTVNPARANDRVLTAPL